MASGWPTTERIEDGDPRALEIRYVARHDGEPALQRCGRDHEIGAVITESGAQGASTSCRSQVERHDAFGVEGQHPVQPGRKWVGKAWTGRALPRNAARYFADADDAGEKIVRTTLRPSDRAPACAARIG
jgi:hypothetical protein